MGASTTRECAFCGYAGKLTREHVISSAILRCFDEVAPYTIDNNRGRLHQADPVTKDLCARCNGELSPVDAAAAAFTGTALRTEIPIGTELEFESELLERWMVKTASNATRSGPNKDVEIAAWWRSLVPFMLGEESRPNRLHCYFGAWRDKSPEQVATKFGIVHPIQTDESVLRHFMSVHDDDLESSVEIAWGTKVGFGVFLFILWRRDVDEQTILALQHELRRYGWLYMPEDRYVAAIPFGEHAGILRVISPPVRFT